MKTVLIILSILLPVCCLSQFSADLGVGAGYISKGIESSLDDEGAITSVRNLFPAANISVSYQRGHIVGEAASYILIGRQHTTPAFAGGSLGYNSGSITGAIGYYFRKSAADDHTSAKNNLGASLKYFRTLGSYGGFSIKSLYTHSTLITTLATTIVFQSFKKYARKRMPRPGIASD